MGNLANMWFPPAAAHNKYPRRQRPFHASKSNSNSRSCISLCIPEYISLMHTLMWTCIPMLDRPSGPLNVFDPWSKLFYKYIHVRRGWPSLGQVHSEFGSELEQPLASRLHWTKGRNMSDKLSKNTQKSQNFIFRQHLSDFGEFTWHPNDCLEFFLDGTNQCPKIIIVTFLLSFLTVTPRGTLDLKALYVTVCVCVCVCQNPSWYPILIVYDHRPIALSWSCCWT